MMGLHIGLWFVLFLLVTLYWCQLFKQMGGEIDDIQQEQEDGRFGGMLDSFDTDAGSESSEGTI
jgi:hypothetical protein